MAVIKHDIVPEGDLELVLKDHSTEKVTPNVILPYLTCGRMNEDKVDNERVDCPNVSAGLPPLQASGKDSITAK